MGAACTRIDVSPEAARAISVINYTQHIHDASSDTIWKSIESLIHMYAFEKRMKIKRLLHSYLDTHPCKDRNLILKIDDYVWHFEIQTNRRVPRKVTEIVFTTRQGWAKPCNPSSLHKGTIK